MVAFTASSKDVFDKKKNPKLDLSAEGVLANKKIEKMPVELPKVQLTKDMSATIEQAIVDMALAISESIMTDHMCDSHKDSGACDRRLRMLDNYDKARRSSNLRATRIDWAKLLEMAKKKSGDVV